MKRTPLFDIERQLGARFTEFSGWELPLYYSSIIEEHMVVRTSTGLFDISHLGKISIKGPRSSIFLNRLATVDIAKIPVGRGSYTLFCNDSGGILDDDVVYRLGDEEFLLIVNASQIRLMVDWLKTNSSGEFIISNLTDDLGLIALQGPGSPNVLNLVFGENPSDYKRYAVKTITVNGNRLTVTRSGYTGEEGYEILSDSSRIKQVFQSLIDNGIKPAGLGARDSLRLEMGYPLYGNDLTPEVTPIEAGLQRFVSIDKDDFIGRQTLLKQIKEGVDQKITGFILERGIARKDDIVYNEQGEKIGKVTSGGYSPVLKQGIGMAYVRSSEAQVGAHIRIQSRVKLLEGRIEERPFVKRRPGTVLKN